jgi:hypothetical protein
MTNVISRRERTLTHFSELADCIMETEADIEAAYMIAALTGQWRTLWTPNVGARIFITKRCAGRLTRANLNPYFSLQNIQDTIS